MSFDITVQGGKSVRLPTANTWCEQDIIVTAEGGGTVDNGVLPAGYTPVPSIKFTGKQAVDTGFICNQNTEIVAAFTIDDDVSCYIYGVTNDAQTASVTAYRSGSGGYWRFGNQRYSITTPVDEEMVYGTKQNKKRILRAGVTTNYSTVSNFIAERTLLIGGRMLNDTTLEDTTMLVGKITAFKIYDGTELTRSFVPCKNADNVCGFWDIITNQFYTTITNTPLEWSFV